MPTRSGSRLGQPTRNNEHSKRALHSGSAVHADNGGVSSGQDALRKLYASLVRCRMVLEQAQKLHSRGSGFEYALALGQEAVEVGTTFDLRRTDMIAAPASNLAAQLAKGISPAHLLWQPDASKTCQCGSRTAAWPGFSGDAFNVGTGVALAHKLEHAQNVVVALCSDNLAPLEQWDGALKFAGIHKLPVLYVVKRTPADAPYGRTHLEEFSFMASKYGFPGIIVDGFDVVAIWRVAQESIHRARNGVGPTLVECNMESPHDPLEHMERYLRKRKAWDEEWQKGLVKEIRAELGRSLEETVQAIP